MIFFPLQSPRCILKILDEECRFPQVGNTAPSISISTYYMIDESQFLCPPLKKEGHIALHMSVGQYVGIP